MTRRSSVLALLVSLAALAAPRGLLAQERTAKRAPDDRFRQLEETLPTPNAYRTASGAPGHEYWQQRVDYSIDVQLDETSHRITGAETITYTNHSPDTLRYLWLQLEPNIFSPESTATLTETAPDPDDLSYRAMRRLLARETFDGTIKIRSVREPDGESLEHTIVQTMMRVELPAPLVPTETFQLVVEWSYAINNSKELPSRTGYELFDDGNAIYELAHWYPRLAAYTDVNGWQHKQFLGRGEFTLELGDFEVRITAPADHLVAATGVLQNPLETLSEAQRSRLETAREAAKPVFVVTQEEAEANAKETADGTKTWVFHAESVRDFAWASSRRFLWDAQGHEVDGNQVLAMSFYPPEAEPLWSKYSTHAIVHTLDVYSRHTFAYPYPVAISVNGPVGGMEYPMICFNGPRPEPDGTYSARTKYGLISVVIHEVGHNYFPMIVNSDERQWTWMDEGLNTFLQFLAEKEWEEDYPSRRGEPRDLVDFLRSADQVPVMTNSESLLQFHNNAYAKPAVALTILRETILGRELFDYAFREYARRWRFRRPQPADLFRTIEDASGVDLDWFWRGWFYTTDHTDIAITGVRRLQLDTRNPDIDKRRRREERDAEPETLSELRNRELSKRVDRFPELRDFYNEFDPLDVTPEERERYEKTLEGLDEDERALLASRRHIYIVDFENLGGLVMPILLQLEHADGSSREIRIPAEIWRRDARRVSKLLFSNHEIERFVVDPRLETADVDLSNNRFPREAGRSRFQLFKSSGRGDNPMRQAREREARAARKAGDDDGTASDDDEEPEDDGEEE